MNRVEQEKKYWDTAAADPDVDKKFISDIDTEDCLTRGIRPYLKYGRTLDLGCGVGRLTIPIAEDTDADVWGLDISEEMLKIAGRRAFEKGLKNIHLTDGGGRTVPFPDGYFDCVYSMLLFQHLPFEGVQSYIEEASRVLISGGVFRFQFIIGEEDEPFSHHHFMQDIRSCLSLNQFAINKTDYGLLHEEWTWITAVKL